MMSTQQDNASCVTLGVTRVMDCIDQLKSAGYIYIERGSVIRVLLLNSGPHSTAMQLQVTKSGRGSAGG